MVWGCITSEGVGRLIRIDGIMNGQVYTEILSQGLLGTLSDFSLGPGDIIFQQDNDPKHKSKLAKAWFDNQNLTVLPWPANSPDMNIIGHVWDFLDVKIRARNPLPKSKDSLWQALQEEWAAIPQDFIKTLYESFPRRIDALVDSKGYATKY